MNLTLVKSQMFHKIMGKYNDFKIFTNCDTLGGCIGYLNNGSRFRTNNNNNKKMFHARKLWSLV